MAARSQGVGAKAPTGLEATADVNRRLHAASDAGPVPDEDESNEDDSDESDEDFMGEARAPASPTRAVY